MDRVKKLIKTYWSFDTAGGYNGIYACMLIISLVFSIFVSVMEIAEVHDYIKLHVAINFQFVLTEISCQMFITSIAVLSIFNISHYKYHKLSLNQKRLFIQLPVSRTDILFTRYIMFLVPSIIPLIDILSLIIINFCIGSINYISSFIGFFIVFYSLWFIIVCAHIGYSDSLTEKNKYIQIFFSIFISSLMLISGLAPLYSSNKVSGKNMYNTFGAWFAPTLKSLSYIGGIGGILVLLASEALGYYLCCRKPIIRFEREAQK